MGITVRDDDGDKETSSATFKYSETGSDQYHPNLFSEPSQASYTPGADYNISIVLLRFGQ